VGSCNSCIRLQAVRATARPFTTCDSVFILLDSVLINKTLHFIPNEVVFTPATILSPDRQLCLPRSCLAPLLLLRHTQQTPPLDSYRIWRKIGSTRQAMPVSPGGALDHAHAVTVPVNSLSPPPPAPPPPPTLSLLHRDETNFNDPSSKQIHTTPL
jgi:hypothetical protein